MNEQKVKLLLKVEVPIFSKRIVNLAIFNRWLHVFKKPNASFDNTLHSPTNVMYYMLFGPTTLLHVKILANTYSKGHIHDMQ